MNLFRRIVILTGLAGSLFAAAPAHAQSFALVLSNGQCLSVGEDELERRVAGARAHVANCNGGANQLWTWRDGTLVAGNGLCLDIHGEDFNANRDDARIQLWECHGHANQQWRLEGSALISGNGKCLDEHGGDFGMMANPGRVSGYHCHGGPNQQWHLQQVAAPTTAVQAAPAQAAPPSPYAPQAVGGVPGQPQQLPGNASSQPGQNPQGPTAPNATDRSVVRQNGPQPPSSQQAPARAPQAPQRVDNRAPPAPPAPAQRGPTQPLSFTQPLADWIISPLYASEVPTPQRPINDSKTAISMAGSGLEACLQAKTLAYLEGQNYCHTWTDGIVPEAIAALDWGSTCTCSRSTTNATVSCSAAVSETCSARATHKVLFAAEYEPLRNEGSAVSESRQRAAARAALTIRGYCNQVFESLVKNEGIGCYCNDRGCACYASGECVLKQQGTDVTWGDSARSLSGKLGTRFTVRCPPNGLPGTVWGTDVYTDDSSVCGAAVHAGVISLGGGGAVTIEMRGGQGGYGASSRNGISSQSWGSWNGSFVCSRP